MKCLCLQAMTVIYGQYFEEIGAFTDTKYILVKLEKVSQVLIIVIHCLHIQYCLFHEG